MTSEGPVSRTIATIAENDLRTVVFVAPFPARTTLEFARAVAGLDRVRLVGLFQKAPKDARAWGFSAVEVVPDVMSADAIVAAVHRIRAQVGPVHRLLAVLEDLQVQLAVARARLGIEGADPTTALRFRDKSRMKDALRDAGLPCARHALLHSAADAWAFVEQVGFPVVLKPPAGAGCRATMRVSSPQELAQTLAEARPSPQREVLAEEFLTGAEYSFETITVAGQPRFWSITRYFPSPLAAMEQDWVQWCVVLPREVDTPLFAKARALGLRTVQALGLQDGVTHMEWFHRPDGSLVIGEIAARPPGARIVQLTSVAHGFDMKRAWARAVVDRAFDGPWPRRRATGVAFLRGKGAGRVASVVGLDAAQERMGELVVDRKLPMVGAPRAQGYEGEGWVVVAHPETSQVKRALFDLITTVKVGYSD